MISVDMPMFASEAYNFAVFAENPIPAAVETASALMKIAQIHRTNYKLLRCLAILVRNYHIFSPRRAHPFFYAIGYRLDLSL